MAVAGISTLGVSLWVAVASGDEKVTDASSYSKLTRINSIGEVTISQETIDASALEDYISRNVAGRGTVSDTITITVNNTDDTMAEWEKILGKKVCFLVNFPDLEKQCFIVATIISQLPFSGADQNSLSTFAMDCTVNNFIGWDTKVEVGNS